VAVPGTICVCSRTLSNNSSTPSSDQKNCASAEDSGMPCPVPIQPHSAKVYHRSSRSFILFLLFSHCWFAISKGH